MVEKEKTPSKKKKSSTQWTLKGLTLWICLTFFACAWMFTLGIFVGRGTVPVRFDIEKLENELAALKEAVIKKEYDRYKLNSPSEDNKTRMEFYDALRKTGSEEKLKTSIPQNKPKPLSKKSVSKVKKALVSKKIATIRKKKTATVKKPTEENKNFTIQVASYQNSEIADKMVARFKKKGYPAYKSIGKIPGKGIVYRVRIGYFKNRAEGGSTFNKLKKENIKAIIVQR